MERKKIAILLSRFPYPLDKGDKLRAYHQIKYVSQYHDVHLFALTETFVSEEDIAAVRPYCKSITIYTLRKYEIALNCFLSILKQIPIQVGYFYSSRIAKQFDNDLIKIQPHSLYCQLSRTALYGKNFQCKKIIDFQDAFSINYKRIQEHVYGIQKLFYARESKLMNFFETKMLTWFDASTIISNFDKEQIKPFPNTIEVVSNGVDTQFFTKNESTKKYDILFCGNLSYIPNKHAALFLIEKIAPQLIAIFPEIKIVVAGSSPGELIQYESNNIHISGWLNDIRDAYNESKLFVAPLFTGAGLQNKLLEAMSMQVPCITTSITNASLKATDGDHLLIANNEIEFVEHIFYLLNNVNLQKKLSENARYFVEQNYSWDAANKCLLNLL